MIEHALKFYGVDWAAITCVFLQLYLLGNKNPAGFVFGMFGSFFWTTFGIMVGSIATPLANIIFFSLNARGLYKWYKDKK